MSLARSKAGEAGVTSTELVGRESFLTGANAISLSRLGMAGLVWIAPGELLLTGTLMVLAAVSDLLDGMVARGERPWSWGRRRRRAPESSGDWLDPLCDKVFIASVLAAIWVEQQAPVWMLLLIGTRELVQLPLLAAYHLVPPLKSRARPRFRSAPIGKLTTALQFAAAAAVLLGLREAVWVAGTASLAGGAASAYYVRRAFRRGSTEAMSDRPGF